MNNKAPWLTSHHSNNSTNNNSSNNPRAFASDWNSYENRHHGQQVRSFGNNGGLAQAPSSARNLNLKNSDRNESGVCSTPALQKFRGACKNNPEPTVTIPDEINGATLNELQKRVVASVLSGYSTFFSGPAGSGKSFILDSILYLNENGALINPPQRKKKRIVITATTGIAACAIGGTTIHSFAGVGIGDGRRDEMVARVMGNEYTKKRWKETDILVIDEISMLPAGFLDTLDFIACRARNSRLPFGGLQLVVCGDFYQLPPVNMKTGFAFESNCWHKVIKCYVLLEQVFRQEADAKLRDILNEARVGDLSQASIQVLRHHSSLKEAPSKSTSIKPTVLECRNKEVDKINMMEMSKLNSETHEFKAKDRLLSQYHASLLKNCPAPETLSLKVGAQVILLKNIDPDRGLVNGSRGIIIDFKVQDKLDTDLLKSWKKVALPLVRFAVIRPSGDGVDEAIERLIEPEEWSNKIGDQTVCSRYQVPLRLAWCLSIHKSQGMTIPHLTCNLQGVFEYGQGYVALSRATKLELLTLRGFNEKCIKAHPKVKEFYKFLVMDRVPNPASFKASSPKNTVKISPVFSKNKRSNLPVGSSSSAANKVSLAPLHPTNVGRGISPVFLKSAKTTSDPIRKLSPTVTPQTTSPPPFMVSITKEQQQRIEENRQRALALRKRKLEEQSNNSGRNISNNPYHSNNQYQQQQQNSSYSSNPYQQR
uniref:ATP-dependent DNA helicase n=1 Tax=Leptocylindrus danicus TaxID=163516 RepID=A0A7S2PDZ7_9STRA